MTAVPASDAFDAELLRAETGEGGQPALESTSSLGPSQSEAGGAKVFACGTAVQARYGGEGRYYPGRIAAANDDGSYDVAYDDGDSEEGVPAALIRTKPKPKPKQTQPQTQKQKQKPTKKSARGAAVGKATNYTGSSSRDTSAMVINNSVIPGFAYALLDFCSVEEQAAIGQEICALGTQIGQAKKLNPRAGVGALAAELKALKLSYKQKVGSEYQAPGSKKEGRGAVADANRVVAAIVGQKQRALGALGGFYATEALGTGDAVVQQELDDALGHLAEATRSSSGFMEMLTYPALGAEPKESILAPIFAAVMAEVGQLGCHGVISDARIRLTEKAAHDCQTADPFFNFHVDVPIVGSLFFQQLRAKYGSDPAECPPGLLANCGLVMDKTASSKKDAYCLEDLLRIPEVFAVLCAHDVASPGDFLHRIHQNTSQALRAAVAAGDSDSGTEDVADTSVGGQLNFWFQLNSGVTCAQPCLGFVPIAHSQSVMDACEVTGYGSQSFSDQLPKEAETAVKAAVGASSVFFFPANVRGRTLVFDGKRVLHSALYVTVKPEAADAPPRTAAEAAVAAAASPAAEKRSSLELRFTQLSVQELEAYKTAVLEETCSIFLASASAI
jgi:hypothetical protein